jgi:pyridoxal phosphate enzyme (YggS family)
MLNGITGNIMKVRDRITSAALASGRKAGDILLIAVTKGVEPSKIEEAYGAGLRHFGENYLDEARAKMEILPRDIRWHFIGHLQRNKARSAALLFDTIQSLDSPSLARRLNQAALEAGKKIRVLLEVNIGGEETKHGISPEDLLDFVTNLGECRGLEPAGLMAIPPWGSSPEDSRPHFRRMKSLMALIREQAFPFWKESLLSMGMTDDYEVAIEEGADIVRIGRGIFGPRR